MGPESLSTFDNVASGLKLCTLFLFVLAVMAFPTGPFIRPHPLFWRFFFGLAVVYELFLLFIFCQSKSDARAFFKVFDSRLGVPLELKEYAADCSFTWANIQGATFDPQTGLPDPFFFSHFMGWLVKSLLLRDMTICWIISVLWEFVELLCLHHLPNFAECWWDQWILDVMISNALGIYVGHKLCAYFEMREYKWRGVREIPTKSGQLQRILLQLTPESWISVRWNFTKSVKRLILAHLIIFFLTAEELSHFYLKHLLWVPPSSKLHLVRMVMLAALGAATFRQVYVYATDPNCNRLGNHAFMFFFIVCTELLIVVKFSANEFSTPMPAESWTLLCGLVFVWVSWISYIFVHMWRRKSAEEAWNREEPHKAE